MSKLNIDQQTIQQLFSDKKSDFLIPDYQRPYAWGETECQTLWDDIVAFAFPDNDYSKFDGDNDEYFLGPIVTFRNENGKLEIIDGQQRLTTLMLLLRAFYSKFENMQDKNSVSTRESIAKCIWKTDEFEQLKTDELKINSDVSSEENKEEFLSILRTGVVDKNFKSQYAENFKFFQDRINEFINNYASYCAYLPARIMKNCILLPIEADNQDVALRIFSTLNDRGMPLSDSDIFKAQLYKYYSDKNQKKEFIERWKELEQKCDMMWDPATGTPMDDLFTRYMYYLRALQGNRRSTTEALRKFYEKDKYVILKQDKTMDELEVLAQFWEDVYNQDKSIFTDRVLKQLYVLSEAPNGMWEYFVSVYFLHYRDEEDKLDEERFYVFLRKITAFIFAYSFIHPGVNALRTPIYPEMVNIVNDISVDFSDNKFDVTELMNAMNNYSFGNQRPITRSILCWWMYTNKDQELFNWFEKTEIEHIYPKKRQERENGLSNRNSLESIGNKALLEKRINIRVSDYNFGDKKNYYKGFKTDKGKVKEGTLNLELKNLSNSDDFTEQDIESRKNAIIRGFIGFIVENDLIK